MASTASGPLWTALVRTHHITSRKKVAKLKAAAGDASPLYVLLRSGSVPGMMYVEGSATGVRDWISTVRALRYKDFQLVHKPGPIARTEERTRVEESDAEPFEEVESVAAFGAILARRGLWGWWRAGMGYVDAGPVRSPS